MARTTPRVNTVTGTISPDELGITMIHTHILHTMMPLWTPPEEATKLELAEAPVCLENLGAIRRNWNIVKDNLAHGDIDAAVKEVSRFKMMGGRSMVEVTPQGMGRDPGGLFKISNATGLHIICSTGWYIASTHPPFVETSSADDLCALMVKELTEGIGTTGIKAGFIKIAMGHGGERPFTGHEEKVLVAAVKAQASTGAALGIHPARPRLVKFLHTYLDIIEREGGRLDKSCLWHMDYFSPEDLKSVLERGVVISYDHFGQEEHSERYGRRESYPTDREAVRDVAALVDAGYASQIVLSDEVAMKCGYVQFGGHGYAHVLENILPDLRYKGLTEEQLDTMMVENPKRILPF